MKSWTHEVDDHTRSLFTFLRNSFLYILSFILQDHFLVYVITQENFQFKLMNGLSTLPSTISDNSNTL